MSRGMIDDGLNELPASKRTSQRLPTFQVLDHQESAIDYQLPPIIHHPSSIIPPLTPFPVTLIAAVSDDGFISRGQGVPWDLPDDRAHFRERTLGRWLLVGRRTYEEMIGWFHNHQPLVLSTDAGFAPAIGTRVATVEAAIQIASDAGAGELMVLGGGQVFAATMPLATRLDLTLVHTRLGTGIPFPAVDPGVWRQVQSRPREADAAHRFSFTFTEWERAPGHGSEA